MYKISATLLCLFLSSSANSQPTAGSSALDWAKQKCVDIGFKAGTERFGNCVLQLSRNEPPVSKAEKKIELPSKSVYEPKKITNKTFRDCEECPVMVVVPDGGFLMGSPPDPAPDPFSNEKPKSIGFLNEKPQIKVQVQSFSIGKYKVTQEEWYAVMGNNPSEFKGRKLPVERVSWDDVQQFIEKLNQKTGQKYRLPSESEWEYAARSGTNADWSHGNDEAELGKYAWYEANSDGKTQDVGQKLPNSFGLFDMHGNVWEWTQDCWHHDHNGSPTDGNAWTTGCADNDRVIRGGSRSSSPPYLRAAVRSWHPSNNWSNSIGFRLAKTLPP